MCNRDVYPTHVLHLYTFNTCVALTCVIHLSTTYVLEMWHNWPCTTYYVNCTLGMILTLISLITHFTMLSDLVFRPLVSCDVSMISTCVVRPRTPRIHLVLSYTYKMWSTLSCDILCSIALPISSNMVLSASLEFIQISGRALLYLRKYVGLQSAILGWPTEKPF